MRTLADVTERARRIRRRRAGWACAVTAVIVVAGTVGVVAATRGHDTSRLVQITPIVAASTTTVVETTSVAATTTSVAETTSTSLDATTTSSVAEATTTSVAETTTTSVAETTTTGLAADPPVVTYYPIAAINADGDAVTVSRDGSTSVLRDGPDPDDPPPVEGDVDGIDSVALNLDRAVALVGTCCEPIPGTILRYSPISTDSNAMMYGHAPAFSPDGTKIVTDVLGAVTVSDLNLMQLATTADDFLVGSGDGFAWIDDQHFVVLEAFRDSVKLTMMALGDDDTLTAAVTSETTGIDGFGVSLAGVDDGILYVRGLVPATPAILTALDVATLQVDPSRGVVLATEPLSAWVQGGEIRWVDVDRHLHIGDAVVPGEFIWVH